MTAYCGTYSGGFNLGKVFGILFLMAILAAGILLGVHALKHSTADAVRNCNKDQLTLTLQNPVTGRKMYICLVNPDTGEFGRMVTENENGVEKEVTSFMNSEARKNTLRKTLVNAISQGYTDILYYANSDYFNIFMALLPK